MAEAITNGRDFRLGNFKGKRVLLSFHPLAWTPVCAQQMQSLEKSKKALDYLNTVAVGLSIDSVSCKAAWAGSLKTKRRGSSPISGPMGLGQITGDPAGRRVFRKGKHTPG